MNGIIYLVGLVVVIMAILVFLGCIDVIGDIKWPKL